MVRNLHLHLNLELHTSSIIVISCPVNSLYELRSPFLIMPMFRQELKILFVKGLAPEKVYTVDIAYNFNYKSVKGRISAFNTTIKDGVELSSYYDSSYRTFVNHSLTNINKSYKGIEAGIAVKLNSSLPCHGKYNC